MSFNLDYGLGALTHQKVFVTVQVKVKNESLEWSLLGQNDRGRRLLFPLRTSPQGGESG